MGERRIKRYLIVLAFLSLVPLSSVGYGQGLPDLPKPGTKVSLTPTFVPMLIKGLTVYPQDPLEFDFIIDAGDAPLKGAAFRRESEKLIKYFLASLTVPEEEAWVNLSPYEKDRVIPQRFGQTQMGRDMLLEDYMLKQVTSSLMSPEDGLGKEFWHRVYAKTMEEFGTIEIPIDTFHKIWIIPDVAAVYEKDNSVFVVEKHLKVMLEEDYIALQHNAGIDGGGLDGTPESDAKRLSGITAQIAREVLIPEIEREVNDGKDFVQLRQMYNSMILAKWYKENLRGSLLGQVYMNKNKISGVNVKDKNIAQKIYEQYVVAFQKGVYNYIREDQDPLTGQMIPRKYLSGGVIGTVPELDHRTGEKAKQDAAGSSGDEDFRVHVVLKGSEPASAEKVPDLLAAYDAVSEEEGINSWAKMLNEEQKEGILYGKGMNVAPYFDGEALFSVGGELAQRVRVKGGLESALNNGLIAVVKKLISGGSSGSDKVLEILDNIGQEKDGRQKEVRFKKFVMDLISDLSRSVEELIEDYEARRDPQLLQATVYEFEGVEGKDVYNGIIFQAKIHPEDDHETSIIAGRVEDRKSELSDVIFFQQEPDGKWYPIKGAPVFKNAQDPSVKKIGDHWVITMVKVEESGEISSNGSPEFIFYSEIFQFETLQDLDPAKRLARGPLLMKDIRLAEFQDGRILVLTRPLGDNYGGGKIGYFIVKDFEKFVELAEGGKKESALAKMMENAKILEGMFPDHQWGGANNIYLLKNGKFGVLGHAARYDEDGRREYAPMTFEFDPETGTFSLFKLIGRWESLEKLLNQEIPIKTPNPDNPLDLARVWFGTHLMVDQDRSFLFGGVRDTRTLGVRIVYPFSSPMADFAAAVGNARDPLGGVNFNAELLHLRIQQDAPGVPIPLWQKPTEQTDVEGFTPVIINITPVNVGELLGR